MITLEVSLLSGKTATVQAGLEDVDATGTDRTWSRERATAELLGSRSGRM